jgi:hypothetical protein
MAALLAVLVLAGCTPQLPLRESYETAIPTALLASDLGITGATASTSKSGFAVYLSVQTDLDRDSMTADELAELLALVYEANNLSNPTGLRLSAWHESSAGDEQLDLAAIGGQLGFDVSATAPNPLVFESDWDDVVAFVREQDND